MQKKIYVGLLNFSYSSWSTKKAGTHMILQMSFQSLFHSGVWLLFKKLIAYSYLSTHLIVSK